MDSTVEGHGLPRLFGRCAQVTTFHARMTAALHSTKERVGEDSDGVLKEAWRSSLGHLLLLQAATLRKDLVTLNLGLAALGAGQRWGQALCWLLESCSRVLHSADAVDQVTYGALLGARFPSALALKLLERMKQQDLEPNAVIHSAVLGACERDGNLAAVPGSLGALAQAGTALNS
ncbi:Pentatricopeptide repeat-containing protein [Durusdinium trenchii]|uniref:Chloroplastic n=1 Tax=Durusdinium trenchii TaxID=1381693 RepID=A0ABP0RNX0_9DINO